MQLNTVRRLVAEGKPAFGTFVYSPDPAIVELIGASGLDFVIVDTEHASLDRRDVENLVRAASGRGISAFVRVSRVEDVTSSLDAGAAAIVAPHFAADERSRLLAESVRYHPEGSRGACTCSRAVDYGITDFATYVPAANEEVWFVGMIEDAAAVEALEDVLATPGLDAVMPGRSDLAASYGVPGQFDHDLVVGALDRILEETARHPRAVPAMYVTSPDDARRWYERGVQVLVYSIDYKVVAGAYAGIARELRGMR
jgi:4-hydroxy-2-oxoheptanedioate aldolase